MVILGRHTNSGYVIMLARCGDNSNDTCIYIGAFFSFIVVFLVAYQCCVSQSSQIWGNEILSNNRRWCSLAARPEGVGHLGMIRVRRVCLLI